ncbi:MAG: threonine--tRNA ligase [Candidatus Azambacteria bacterium]|nr:threonine--tRNA ligase [Candidatus Azambacteria bacterium]
MKTKKIEPEIENARHSLSHLLATAVLKKFPDVKFGIGPIIENGFYYDFLLPKSLLPEDLKDLEKEIKNLISQKLPFIAKKITAIEAKRIFKNQPFKLDLIKEFVKNKWALTIYKTGDVFVDLCAGGHVKNSGEINIDAFQLTHTAGAYWRGDEKNPQLQRVYGVAFETKKELGHYLWQQEEAKKRDHRILGEKLSLFTFADEVGPGLPLWMPNGTIVRDEIEKYAKEIEKEWGYERVATPHIAKEKLYLMSGHIPYYADSMYPPMKLDDGNYYLKAMNCPHTHMIYRARQHSYRELPIKYAEYGTVYRYELSGTLAGLLRTRGFTQNDAHIYCREDQAEEEFLNVMKLHEFWYKKVFGIKDFYMRLSLPTKDKKKFAGASKEWIKAVEIVRNAMKKSKLPFVEVEGEAAFYGPKVDFQIKSVIGREETASTNQLDLLATEKFNLTYKDKDGKDKPVYVIHRAPLGSHERFIAFLIEHYAGAFPIWFAPIQVSILNITERNRKYATKIYKELKDSGIRVEFNDANDTIGKKIRNAELLKIPYILIIGDKEEKSGAVAVRERGKGDLGKQKLSAFLRKIQLEIENKI